MGLCVSACVLNLQTRPPAAWASRVAHQRTPATTHTSYTGYLLYTRLKGWRCLRRRELVVGMPGPDGPVTVPVRYRNRTSKCPEYRNRNLVFVQLCRSSATSGTGIIILVFELQRQKPLEQTWRGQALTPLPKRGVRRDLTGRSSRPSRCCRRCSQRATVRTKRPVIYPLLRARLSDRSSQEDIASTSARASERINGFVSSTSRIVLSVLRARRSEERKRRLGSGP